MKVLYFDCFSGAAGDMILGALIDAGASEEAVRASLDALQVSGWELRFESTTRAGLRATKAEVEVEPGPGSRRYADIESTIHGAPLDDGVTQRALATFRALAEAEARVHGVAVGEVHLHEAGALDAIVDVVGSSAALESIDPQLVVTSPIATGHGFISSAHGRLPIPAPAVVELLSGATLIERGTDELITPTGAAILATATDRFGSMPPMRLSATGYGAGTLDPEVPNVVRVMIGELDEAEGTPALLIECNIDDMSPELIPYVIERSMAAGAQDAWSTSIQMKKGRPALKLAVLTTHADADSIMEVLFTETSTLGVRMTPADKRELDREWADADVEGYTVRVKLGRYEGRVVTASPEYEDASKVARLTGLPLKEVYRRATRFLE